ncbi:hypothetical protein RhiJN_08392 [Ceratobasidium sp. AG-Ba]|nr:hypothetical protein RhiJN_08392 [Ceratobasidium sp. AG-Ba]QRW09174.1 hypothetical protein RhiLY_08173 [Ceratobasidium sp. AG-Ba]
MSSNGINREKSTPVSVSDTLSQLQILEEALAGANSVLAHEGEELNERDLAQLLKELEAADDVADGVETKLDELLKNIGGMLEGLEGADPQGNNMSGGENKSSGGS